MREHWIEFEKLGIQDCVSYHENDNDDLEHDIVDTGTDTDTSETILGRSDTIEDMATAVATAGHISVNTETWSDTARVSQAAVR